jgi:hypothetical protein
MIAQPWIVEWLAMAGSLKGHATIVHRINHVPTLDGRPLEMTHHLEWWPGAEEEDMIRAGHRVAAAQLRQLADSLDALGADDAPARQGKIIAPV